MLAYFREMGMYYNPPLPHLARVRLDNSRETNHNWLIGRYIYKQPRNKLIFRENHLYIEFSNDSTDLVPYTGCCYLLIALPPLNDKIKLVIS